MQMKRNGEKSRRVRVGVDTGGTFTDFVFEAKDGLRVFKIASTPADPSTAITEGLRRVLKGAARRRRSSRPQDLKTCLPLGVRRAPRSMI
jgi:N-methylhydantoinase A/oxoprolinase/acetone carboxylase beta subunit